jgi:uroporphyrinogen-III synthase
MARRVLVTRPEPGASATASRLRQVGYEPVVAPLSTIVPLAAGTSPSGAFDAALATSANALRHAPAGLLRQAGATPLFVAGEQTAKAARAAGLRPAAVAPNAEALGREVAAELPPGARLLYLCGRVRMPELERQLAAAGYPVTSLETYDTIAAADPAADIFRGANGRPVDAVLVHSAVAARSLMGVLDESRVAGLIGGALFVAISERVRNELAGLRSTAGETPDEAAMLARLAALL